MTVCALCRLAPTAHTWEGDPPVKLRDAYKKVVVWFAKLGLLCVAADTKNWSLASRKAAILLQHEAGEDDVDPYGGIAALGFVNGHLFLSFATKICPNFSNQTTTFLEKKTDLCVPKNRP